MKLLVATHSYYPAFSLGGPVQTIHLMNLNLVGQGVEVSVLTTNAGLENNQKIKINEWINEDGVKVKYFKYYGNRFYNISPGLAFEAARILKNFDIVHITPVWNFPCLFVAYLCIILRKPFIVSPRGTLYREAIELKSTYLKKIYYFVFVKYFLKKASFIHYTSEDEKKKVSEYLELKNEYVVIHNGLNLSEYANLPKRNNFRKKFNIKKNDIVILFLGRINLKKGLDLLLSTFRKLAGEFENLYLVIAGFDSDGYEIKLKNMVRNSGIDSKVIFAGPLLDDEKLKAYTDAECFVLPSYTENFGMAVIEAMAAGCPVVVSNRVGIYDLIEKHDAGIVVEPNNVSLYEGIYRLIDSSELRRNCSENGRSLVKDYFDIDKVSKEMIKNYKSLLY